MTGPRHLTSQPWRRAALGLIGTVAVFALAACSEDAGGSDAAVPSADATNHYDAGMIEEVTIT